MDIHILIIRSKILVLKKYNLILLLNLIEHIADPTATLKKLTEYLEPGGIILIKTPNIDSLDFRIFKIHIGADYIALVIGYF